VWDLNPHTSLVCYSKQLHTTNRPAPLLGRLAAPVRESEQSPAQPSEHPHSNHDQEIHIQQNQSPKTQETESIVPGPNQA
jgi:hypothetical protein